MAVATVTDWDDCGCTGAHFLIGEFFGAAALFKSLWPVLSLPYCCSSSIQRADHTLAAFIQHMGINHRCGNIGMAEQLLYGANVIA